MKSTFSRVSLVAIALGLLAPQISRAGGGDDSSPTRKAPAATTPDNAGGPAAKPQEDLKPVSLLDALRQGSVAVQTEGRDDGRVTVSVTNKTRKPLRVVLPPGIIAQSATGQMGGMMGGMGGGGMGGMGGMGGGMGGMGGGGMGGGMGGMGGGMRGGMGRGGGTMPPMMGMMMLGRIIMYFCGDYDSWDMRSMMMGMGMMGGGMGGGMMGGMGGGMMGGMGGGMRSLPPTGPPFADLRPGQTRQLPTRFVSLTPPDAEGSVRLPREGDAFKLMDIADVTDNPRVQKALKRLAGEKAATRVCATRDVERGGRPGLADDRRAVAAMGQPVRAGPRPQLR